MSIDFLMAMATMAATINATDIDSSLAQQEEAAGVKASLKSPK